MVIQLRHFQALLERDIYSAWGAGAQNVMPVAPTGSGKTVVLSKLLRDEPGASIAIAHRQELVSQISLALARNGVRHRVVGAKKGSPLVRVITALQVAELGYSFLDPTARCGVAGVDTLVKMSEPWFNQVRLAVQDEGHHVLRANKWGRAASLFPNARGLFPTATPLRADGRGLGRHSDGLADALVLAPSMREIINSGYLTDYKIYAPPTKGLDFSNVDISPTTGDLNQHQAAKVIHENKTIVGNVVEHYLRLARGKLGLTFAIDVEEAGKISAEFRAAGVPAEVLSAKTPDGLRASVMRSLHKREILQVVNVDLFGEGVDVPAVEVISMARPTDSFSLYTQQFGRMLRLMIQQHLRGPGIWDSLGDAGRLAAIKASVKPYGICIDHVGNYIRHNGPPDQRIEWSLDARERRGKGKSDAIPVKVCVECLQPYESSKKRCPYCDHYMQPASRGGPEFVDGDLTELSPEYLAAIRGEIVRKDGDFEPNDFMSGMVNGVNRARWNERKSSVAELRNAIAWWAGVEAARGYGESESYRRFYFRFGVDVANAQLLGAREAAELSEKVHRELAKYGVDVSVSTAQ